MLYDEWCVTPSSQVSDSSSTINNSATSLVTVAGMRDLSCSDAAAAAIRDAIHG